MRRYTTLALFFLFISVVNFMLAGAAQPRAIYDAPDVLGQVAKGATKELNPGIPPTNSERPLVNPPQTPQPPPQPADPEPDPDEGKYFNLELKDKIKDYITLATVEVAVGAGIAEGFQREGDGQIDPGVDTVILRDLIARAFGVSRTLNDHPQDLVPRSLSNLRDEDLQFLNALSRRLLECLD